MQMLVLLQHRTRNVQVLERVRLECSLQLSSVTTCSPEGLAFTVLLQGTGTFSTLASSLQCFTYRLKINLQPVSCPSQDIFHSETFWSRGISSVCPSVCGFGQQIIVLADKPRFFIGKVHAKAHEAAQFLSTVAIVSLHTRVIITYCQLTFCSFICSFSQLPEGDLVNRKKCRC